MRKKINKEHQWNKWDFWVLRDGNTASIKRCGKKSSLTWTLQTILIAFIYRHPVCLSAKPPPFGGGFIG